MKKTKNSFGLRQYMIIVFSLFGIILIALIFPIMNTSVTRLEEELIANRLVADIHYIEDLIGDGEWNLKGNYICKGDVVVGDGTQEHANLEPFLLHEEKTRTFSYVFIRCGDEGLTYVESTPTQKGYQQGHFLRVAGSTRDPNGNSIVGTYMDKQVADILDAQDFYDGEANVAGGMIYCRYDTLKDKRGNVIGAIVVGRNISELKEQISNTTRGIIIAGVAIIIIGCILLFLIIDRWVKAMRGATNFLERIEKGDIPNERLETHGLGEVDVLSQGINSLADTLRENEELRVKSETDQLTGLANRFGLNNHGREIFNRCLETGEPVAIGMLDIDYFKAYNDNYGHQMGDACIINISRILKKLENEGKLFAARYGGDEFIIIIQNRDQNGVKEIADEIQQAVSEASFPHAFSEISAFVTVSQGYYMGVPEQGETLIDFFSIADTVMYKVKSGSKNSYQIKVAEKQGEAGNASGTEDADLISWSTYHDYLTRLLNREGFAREASRVLRENPDEEFYIVRSNIRDFKLVNQLFGYEKGNEILIEMANMLRNGKIETEVAGRIHGDHFVFLIKRKNYDENLIRNCFMLQSKKIENTEFVLRYHIGVYAVTDKTTDITLMCDRANMAISSIQSDTESNLAYYNDSMMADILKENVIIAEFETALADRDFKLFLQPLINTAGNLVGAEALVRWHHKEDGRIIQPSEFIPTLEKAGLIHKMDLLMWEEAARILKSWQGTPMEYLSISVNISPKDIHYVDIDKTFVSLTERYGIKPEQLNLEFTETTLISNVEQYIALISSLREKGFHVEIDDFGSGYSSLNMLKEIRADALKIDKDFLKEIENRDRSRSILASIVDMTKKLRMTVIAEGVETESQFRFLMAIGCDLFQGFYFSKPVAVNEFLEKYFPDRKGS